MGFIESIQEQYDSNSGTYIAIKVKNPTKYIIEEKTLYQQLIRKVDGKYFHEVFAIHPTLLKGSSSELMKDFNRAMRKYSNLKT